MVDEIFRGQFACQWHNWRCWQFSFSSHICRLWLLQPLRTLCNFFEKLYGPSTGNFANPQECLFARHQLLSAGRKVNKSFVAFSVELKRFVEDCQCTSCTVQAPKDYLIRAALLSECRSDDIRARLLEMEYAKANIDSCISLACAIELSSDFPKPFQRNAESSTVAAAK